MEENKIKNVHIHFTRLISKAGAISERKLDEFLGWYPIMKKRSEEGSDVGPDAMAIERQLQECKVSVSF